MKDNPTVKHMKNSLNVLVYSSVSIEGIGATFAQTRDIVESGTAAGVDSVDLDKILNIKHAWESLFENYQEEPSWERYSDYNRLIGRGYVKDAGLVRPPGSVIVGTNLAEPYIPPDVTGKEDFERLFKTAINCYDSPDDAAVAMFLMLCRDQFFHDGNKRSAQLLTNHYLAHKDAGFIFCIPEESRDEVLDILVDFYTGRLSLDDAEFDLYNISIMPVPKNPSSGQLGALFSLSQDIILDVRDSPTVDPPSHPDSEEAHAK